MLLYVVHMLIENLCKYIFILAVWWYVHNTKMCVCVFFLLLFNGSVVYYSLINTN